MPDKSYFLNSKRKSISLKVSDHFCSAVRVVTRLFENQCRLVAVVGFNWQGIRIEIGETKVSRATGSVGALDTVGEMAVSGAAR